MYKLTQWGKPAENFFPGRYWETHKPSQLCRGTMTQSAMRCSIPASARGSAKLGLLMYKKHAISDKLHMSSSVCQQQGRVRSLMHPEKHHLCPRSLTPHNCVVLSLLKVSAASDPVAHLFQAGCCQLNQFITFICGWQGHGQACAACQRSWWWWPANT